MGTQLASWSKYLPVGVSINLFMWASLGMMAVCLESISKEQGEVHYTSMI